MLKQTGGSRAMAEAIALSRPEAICAYPITRRARRRPRVVAGADAAYGITDIIPVISASCFSQK